MVVLDAATCGALLGGPYAQGAPQLKLVQKRYLGMHHWLSPVATKDLKEQIVSVLCIMLVWMRLGEFLRKTMRPLNIIYFFANYYFVCCVAFVLCVCHKAHPLCVLKIYYKLIQQRAALQTVFSKVKLLYDATKFPAMRRARELRWIIWFLARTKYYKLTRELGTKVSLVGDFLFLLYFREEEG